jgi:hypothetical protein
VLAELNRCCGCWPKTTGRWWRMCTPGASATVWSPATLPQPDARPRDRGLWYCRLIEPNAWGASQIRASFWGPCRERAPSGHDGLGSTGTALTRATLGRRTVVPTVHSGGGGDAKGPKPAWLETDSLRPRQDGY